MRDSVIRYTYVRQAQPPAPFVQVRLQNPITGNTLENIPAQLDLAADRNLDSRIVGAAIGTGSNRHSNHRRRGWLSTGIANVSVDLGHSRPAVAKH